MNGISWIMKNLLIGIYLSAIVNNDRFFLTTYNIKSRKKFEFCKLRKYLPIKNWNMFDVKCIENQTFFLIFFSDR